VDDSRVRTALLEDRRIREILDLAAQADVALVGIGVTDPALSSMVRAGYLTVEQGRVLQSQGAVGDVCGHNFDLQGQLLDIPMAGYVMVSALRLWAATRSVAGGASSGDPGHPAKPAANALVTDDQAARVLELAQVERKTK
jgi:DNA-binding transcriptional regulator LsrR (DeoR family)